MTMNWRFGRMLSTNLSIPTNAELQNQTMETRELKPIKDQEVINRQNPFQRICVGNQNRFLGKCSTRREAMRSSIWTWVNLISISVHVPHVGLNMLLEKKRMRRTIKYFTGSTLTEFNTRNERVIHMPYSEEGRVVLVFGSDPFALRNKVQEVIKMMEIDLGEGWIFHKLCKVYLFISSRRVVGCVVAEPIKEAFKVLPCSVDRRSDGATAMNSKSDSSILRFGEIILQRETTKRAPAVSSLEVLDGESNGAIVCEERAAPAICGIRAIWVTPSNRKKGIANQLLDAVRRSFCTGFTLQQSQIAFSPPTSAGKALASNYTGTASFMVYKPNAVDS
ncbi:protein CHROMOSOME TRANSMISSION FIDELITY 7 isoform X3 [Manihot esculenta]|uniref:protein CHROMOSOME TRANSMISSION FIDELITY 7 isoform X3 n=1 Tax=Manihot esculenta TaxID=3983 RepID=UPI001CC542CF|nr:protein CHROMOSOME TRANSMISSION FIDELITY 7 isoform X3 [Manihot esculenta]